MRMTFVTVKVFSFENGILSYAVFKGMFKVPSQKLRGTLTTAF